ncbi:MAG: pantetheine-phosphate adenylyltransferase [Duncaniella sp.]|nr:pantetheine-phosphate adenylyltransferase [Duncaniella sp.]
MSKTSPERTILFAGSFDPFTRGHQSLVSRALPLCDRLVIALGHNSSKAGDAGVSERLRAIRALYASEPRVEVVAYSGLTVDACREHGAGWMLRGVRSVADFEYERNLADVNRAISGIETLILFTLPELAAVSSSVVRELRAYGHDVSPFLPLEQ